MGGERYFGPPLHSLDPAEERSLSKQGVLVQHPRNLLPDNYVFRRNILSLTVGSLTLNIGGIQRGGYLDDEAGSRKFRVEIGLDRDGIRDCRCSNLIHGGQYFDGEFHVGCGTVATVASL